jgi:pimeloyl-ACP methyl ester carboxylesterase
LDAFAAALLGDLTERDVDRFDVVGMSMGGYVAFALWRAAPERVRSLVLCSTRATADADGARRDRLTVADRALSEQSTEFVAESMVDRLLGPAARREPHVTDPLLGRIRRAAPAGIAFAQRAMAARPDSSDLLQNIDVPTLVISGRHDALVSLDEQRAMAAGIAGCRHLEMDCGHLPNLELPQEFNDVLEDHLALAR